MSADLKFSLFTTIVVLALIVAGLSSVPGYGTVSGVSS